MWCSALLLQVLYIEAKSCWWVSQSLPQLVTTSPLFTGKEWHLWWWCFKSFKSSYFACNFLRPRLVISFENILLNKTLLGKTSRLYGAKAAERKSLLAADMWMSRLYSHTTQSSRVFHWVQRRPTCAKTQGSRAFILSEDEFLYFAMNINNFVPASHKFLLLSQAARRNRQIVSDYSISVHTDHFSNWNSWMCRYLIHRASKLLLLLRVLLLENFVSLVSVEVNRFASLQLQLLTHLLVLLQLLLS